MQFFYLIRLAYMHNVVDSEWTVDNSDKRLAQPSVHDARTSKLHVLQTLNRCYVSGIYVTVFTVRVGEHNFIVLTYLLTYLQQET